MARLRKPVEQIHAGTDGIQRAFTYESPPGTAVDADSVGPGCGHQPLLPSAQGAEPTQCVA
jgi:hypothetical protein